jgi:hypothetical protein
VGSGSEPIGTPVVCQVHELDQWVGPHVVPGGPTSVLIHTSLVPRGFVVESAYCLTPFEGRSPFVKEIGQPVQVGLMIGGPYRRIAPVLSLSVTLLIYRAPHQLAQRLPSFRQNGPRNGPLRARTNSCSAWGQSLSLRCAILKFRPFELLFGIARA